MLLNFAEHEYVWAVSHIYVDINSNSKIITKNRRNYTISCV